MEFFILAFHVIAAISIIVLVLLQQGKGADMGASFGTGSAGSVFGAAGSANFLSRSTAIAAAIFICTSVALTYFGAHRGAVGGSGLMQGAGAAVEAPKSPSVDKPEPAKSGVPVTGAAVVPAPSEGREDCAPAAAVVPAPSSSPAKSDVPK